MRNLRRIFQGERGDVTVDSVMERPCRLLLVTRLTKPGRGRSTGTERRKNQRGGPEMSTSDREKRKHRKCPARVLWVGRKGSIYDKLPRLSRTALKRQRGGDTRDFKGRRMPRKVGSWGDSTGGERKKSGMEPTCKFGGRYAITTWSKAKPGNKSIWLTSLI